MKIRIITTGGTIDKVYFDAQSAYEVGESHVPDILRDSNVTFEYDVINLMRKDSLELTEADRRLIRDTVASSDVPRIVVTHGTDTIVETAKALVGVPGRVVVLTGSLHPARFKTSDAVFNVAAAVTAAQTLPEGVYIAMNGRIFGPHEVRKNRERNRFEKIDGDGSP
jgi:L-asparaginase